LVAASARCVHGTATVPEDRAAAGAVEGVKMRSYFRVQGLISPVAVFRTIGFGDSLMPKNN
jgi:hypothetical protein